MPASLTPWPPADKGLEEVETSPNGRYIRYNILLGKGACKRVYKALDTTEGTEVAWNQVDMLGMDRDGEARQHLQEEIRVLQTLKHKNIMTFYAWWYDPSNLHINFITELFTAGNLRQYRKKLKRMSENVLKRWAHQILEGLLYLHGHTPPIVHRDLKCDNIFVNSATGEVKIGDLGLATVQQTAMSVVGTPEFMAPEVYEESYDERADIYSFGMCLLELATQEYPYSECHSVPQIFKKVTLGIPPASLARVGTPELRDFIALCIAHDPHSRPSARELLKHPYLEAVRLNGTESLSLQPSGSSNMLSAMGGSSNPGTGWNTPSGTVHCGASVRDLREALHQQEALARHLQQQGQHLLQMQVNQQLGGGSGSETSAAAPAQDAGGMPTTALSPISRTLTGPILAPPPAGLPPVLIRSPSAAAAMPSPLSRCSLSPRAGGEEPAAPLSPTAAAAAGDEVTSRPSPLGRGAGGGGSSTDSLPQRAAGAGDKGEVGGSHDPLGSMDSAEDDSDEEVLVPIEVVKSSLLQEGFVDADAFAFSEPSEAGSDPSALSLIDPHLLRSVISTPPNSFDMLSPSAAAGPSRRPRGRKLRRLQQSLLSKGSGITCDPIREGGEDEEDACPSSGTSSDASTPERGPSYESDDEDSLGNRGLQGAPSLDLDPTRQVLQVLRSRQATAAAAAAVVLAAEAVLAAGEKDVAATSSSSSAKASQSGEAVGEAPAGFEVAGAVAAPADVAAGGAASGDVLLSLACSVCSSNSTARHSGLRTSPGVGSVHSRNSSSEAVTFRLGSLLGASGTATPVLRTSCSGAEPLLEEPVKPPPTAAAVVVDGAASAATTGQQPADAQAHVASHPPAQVQLPGLAHPAQPAAPRPAPLGRSASLASGPGSLRLPAYFTAHSHASAGAGATALSSVPGGGRLGSLAGGDAGALPPSAVRLPSFRNRVLLTMSHPQSAPAGPDSPTGPDSGGNPVRCLRTTSARLPSSRLGDVSALFSASAPLAGAQGDLDGEAAGATLPEPPPRLSMPGSVSTWTAGGGGSTAASSTAYTPAAVTVATSAAYHPALASALESVPEGDATGATSEQRPAVGGPMGASGGGGSSSSNDGGVVGTLQHPRPDEVVLLHESAPLPTVKMIDNEVSVASSAAAAMAAVASGDGARSLTGPYHRASAPGASNTRVDASTSTSFISGASTPLEQAAQLLEPMAALVPGGVADRAAAVLRQLGKQEDLTVVREYARPIQGVIMRLKQFRRMVRDRAKALRS